MPGVIWGNLEHGRIKAAGTSAAQIIVNIPIRQYFCVATEAVVQTGRDNLMESERSGHCRLVDLKNRDGGVQARRCASGAASHTCGEYSVVAVVHEHQVKDARIPIADETRSMLRVEPVSRVGVDLSVVHQREVSAFSKSPENTSVAGTVGVVHLDKPVLVTNGDDEVSVIRGIDDGVRVGPVRKHKRVSVDVKVIELIPNPDWIPILIEIDNHVAENLGRRRLTVQGNTFQGVGHHQDMTVR